MDIPIIYEDDDVVVINKPAGLIVHSDGRTLEPSVTDFILSRYPQLKGVGESWLSPQGETVDRPGIVHRLDRTTSGVLIVAKSQEAHSFLKSEFHERSVEKEYLAYVYGHLKINSGTVDAEIERVRSVPPRWGARMMGSGTRRAAITHWEVLQRGTDRTTGEKTSLLKVMPKTGRTHQIRVHLQAIHHSVVCDPLYAKGQPCILGFARVALHAFRLTLTLPSGERKKFEASLPLEFLEAEKQFVASNIAK